ncbi:MAG: DegT/DnrJ/EryC1/StrS family aminotransferase [Pseudomonadota bacterium]
MAVYEPIPMVDLRANFAPLREEILAGVAEILDTGQFILGPHGRALEESAAAQLGVNHAIGCASGTDALLLALRALDIGSGDEVIVPTFTFIATAEAVLYVGATPVFVDVNPHSFNIDVAAAAAAITPRTKAIIPVHLYGQPADMLPLMALADQHGVPIIEDCAQSFGAHIDGRMAGSFGRIGAFSFFPSKNLGGAGDGGMVVTNDEKLAARLRVLRNHGSSQQYYHDELGYNSRLDEIQALVLRLKLTRINDYTAGRRNAAALYRRYLGNLDLVLPQERSGFYHVYHQFTIQLEERDRVRAELAAQGIASAVYYPVPCHRQRMFAPAPTADCPAADRLAGRVLSLPMYPELQEAQVARIAEALSASIRG